MLIRMLPDLQPERAAFCPTSERPVRLVVRDMKAQDAVPVHQHPWAQIAYAAVGVVRVSVTDTSWIVPPSRAIWIPAGTEHDVAMMEDGQLRTLYILPSATSLPANECQVIEISGLLRELISSFARCETDSRPRREHLMADLILDELCVAKALPLRIPLPRDKRLRSLCQSLMADPSREMTLAQWAEEVGASARTLARLFRSELGTNFTLWRQQMRLAHAAPLVARGYPLSRVASELGYNSQSAFTAMFRRTFGMSPRRFFSQQPEPLEDLRL